MQLPAIDQNVCGDWTQDDRSAYAQLPYFLELGKTQYRQRFATWPKLLGKRNWQKNQGDTMKVVMIEPTPVIRQFAEPNLLSVAPKVDVVSVRERTTTAQLRWQDFMSPVFGWQPSFESFMKGHIAPSMDNINKQMMIFEEFFLRGYIWNWAPQVYVAGVGLVDAPQGATAATGKTTAWVAAQLAQLAGVENAGHLSFKEIYLAQSIFVEDVGATPFEGSGTPGGDSAPLNEKYCLVQSSESWNALIDDPWLKENRPLNMNIVNGAYKGDFFGRVCSKIERYPIRISVDNNFSPTYNEPETQELNSSRDDYGRTKPNPVYSQPSQSPFEISFLVGGAAYDKIDPGTPPPDFTKPLDGREMDWSGKTYLTKNFLVPCANVDGNTHYDTNSFGRYLRLQSSWAGGIIGTNAFNVLPIIHKRKRIITTTIDQQG